MKRKIKICFCIEDFHMGGAEKLLIQLIENLDPEVFSIHLLCFKNQGCLFKELPAVVSKICVTRNPWLMYRYFKQERFDIVHTHLIKADMAGLFLGWLAGVPGLFSTRHNVRYFTGKKKILKGIDAWLLGKTKGVIAISKAVQNYYRSQPGYQQVPFQVIHNGVLLEPFLKLPLKEASLPLQLLTVGSLTRQKGHLEFLSILKEMPPNSFAWHLVGEGPMEKKIKERVKAAGLEACIYFHGVQESSLAFYEKADLFVLPSLWEGFGLVLVEAMAAGVPVFASGVDGIPEIVQQDKNGILFSWKNKEEIINLLSEVLNKPVALTKLSGNTRDGIEEFGIQKMVMKYSEVYGQIPSRC